MNFPENQQTGVLAELDVKRLFMSWGWNVGRDQVDDGYDLLVAPDRNRFRGARFLVQAFVVRLRNFLHWIRTLSRLHLVARSLNSELPYEPGRVFRHEEIGDIDLAYLLLKGDRRRVQLDRLEFDAHPTLAGGVVCSGKYLDTLTFTVNGHHLGDIPVTIELTDYVSESVAGSDRSRLVMTAPAVRIVGTSTDVRV